MLARLFVFFGGLIVLALTVALVGPYFVDWSSYRADFEREASAALGEKVTVRGEATAKLLPFPSVTFTDVLIGDDQGNGAAMSIDAFSMDAELAPFLRGELLIFDMRLVRPRARVTVAADGTLDWTAGSPTRLDGRQITIEKMTVTDGRITLVHAAGGREHVVSDISAEISARSLAGPWQINGDARINGVRTALVVSTGAVDAAGAMRLRIKADAASLPATLESDGSVRLDKSVASYAGDFRIDPKPPVEGLRGSDGQPAKPVAGNRVRGKFKLGHKRLTIDEFRFETGPLDDPYVADGSASIDFGPAPRFAVNAKGAQVRLTEAQGGAAGGSLSVAARLSALGRALAALPRPAIPGTIDVSLPAIVAGDTTVRDVRIAAEPAPGGWKLGSLAASLPGRTTLEASGLVRTAGEFGFTGSMLLAVGQPSGFAAWVAKDVDEVIRRLPAAGFSAKVDITAARQVFSDMELMLGDARFKGKVESREFDGTRPAIVLKLDGDELDFDGLAAFASLFVSESGANRFAASDFDFDIKAGPVHAAGMTAERLDTALRLRKGLLEIDRLSIGGLAGASVSATGTVKGFPENPTGNIDATLIADDLAPLASLAAAGDPSSAVLAALVARSKAFPGLLRNARVNVVASAAGNGDGSTGIAVSATGAAGGSAFSLALSGSGRNGSLAEAPLSLSLDARNKDAAALIALYGLPVDGAAGLGAGQTSLVVNGKSLASLDAAVDFSSEGFKLGFSGKASLTGGRPAAKGRFALEANDVEPVMTATGFALPGMGMGLPATLTADADYDGGLLVLSGLEGAVDEGAVSGDVNVEFRNGMPSLTGALSIDSVDLAQAAALVFGESALAPGSGPWPATPFLAKPVAPFAAQLDIATGSLSVGGAVSADNVNMTLGLDRDGLRVSGLTAKLYGGDLSGLVELKNSAGTGMLSSQLKLAGADLGLLLPDSGLDGKADVTASLSSSGKSIGGLVAALSGSGSASLHGLNIEGLNSGALPELLARADALGRDIDGARTAEFAPDIVGQGGFAAGDAEMAFTVAGGVFRAPPLSLGNPDATLALDIRADLNALSAEVAGSVAYKPGEEALVGSEPTVRFTAEGAPGAMQRLFDTEPLGQFLTQRALEREQARVEAMQTELLEKQRLRREARYYASLQQDRDRIADEKRRAEEEAKRKAEEDARQKAAAEEKARADARARADEEARRKAADAARARAEADARAAAAQADQAARLAEAERARRDAVQRQQGAAPLPGVRLTPVPQIGVGERQTGGAEDRRPQLRFQDLVNPPIGR